MKILLRYLEYILRMGFFSIKFVIAYINHLFNRNGIEVEWIISERGDEARDNGYHLFKYIRKNHPNINVYYIITKDSPDFLKVNKYENILYYGTLEHYKGLIKAEYLISTHSYGYAEYGKAIKPFLKILPDKKIINLRHGVVYNDLKMSSDHFDLIMASSDMEKNIITKSNSEKLPIKITGICRYDNLKDTSDLEEERIILLMPTFRSWLHDLSRMPNGDRLFIEEDYYKFYNDLISNEKILKLCKQNNLKLYFYPHYRIQPFLDNFKVNDAHVILADKESYDIQDLLNRSSVLITDYSSIFFDFAYMKKPVIYTQFDEEKFRSKHYKESSFSFEKNGFGEVVTNLIGVQLVLEEIIANNFEMEKKYKKRVDAFFNYRDANNCKRNLQEIKNL